MHFHDRKLTKIIREDHPGTVNQYDTWHATKALTKAMGAVASGAKCRHNITWHRELGNKVGSVKTNAHWCMRNCDGDADQLDTSFSERSGSLQRHS